MKTKAKFKVISDINASVSYFLSTYSEWVEAIWNWHSSKNKNPTLRDDYIMTVGLAGEVGEVLEILKKKVRDKKSPEEFDREHLVEELGDVLYYFVKIANRHDISLDEIIMKNYSKLEERYKKRLLKARRLAKG